MRSVFLLAALPIASLFAPPAFGWGCEGHQIVALIARAHLTPAASAAVDELLKASPIDPALNRFCKDRPNDIMADVASWADDVRTPNKNGEWHYINIPRSVTERTSIEKWCPPIGAKPDGTRTGCVVNALQYFTSILRDKTLPVADRAEALRYVIHFTGDIHQPLHDIDNYDEGGNCTSMRMEGDDRITNLHSIWDTRMIQREMAQAQLNQQAFAAKLNSEFASKYAELAKKPANDPESWAWESDAIGRNVVYGDLAPGLPVVASDPGIACPVQRDKVAEMHIVIDDSYIRKALPYVNEQLADAGFRLALLLNSVL